eukprot:TRINITY_DN10649_c0_g1_i2.p1 TRINITY_DN10649_c0_g1~~TRINITY_DN10649_c0_g1_i2.p1  ORF type:complete len:200 (-),score=48.03 TRINITY_DN10649_c0_g1_i2:186-785(-)
MEWAVIADVDIESEAWRCLGSNRFIVGILSRVVCCLRRYSGSLKFLPAETSTEAPREAFFDEGGSGVLPELGSGLGDEWEAIEGDFNLVWVCNTTHMAPNAEIAPGSELDDGLFHIIVIRKVCCCPLLCAMSAMEDNGAHIDHDCVEVSKARAYRFVPEEGLHGRICIDGELCEYEPIQAEMFPGVAQVFANGSCELSQ